jgi:hypothetical protein
LALRLRTAGLTMGSDEHQGDPRELRNRQVSFHINDIYVPEPAMVLEELHGNDLLHGRVLDLSDAGAESGVFAVVDVEGLRQSVVVPVAKIVNTTE